MSVDAGVAQIGDHEHSRHGVAGIGRLVEGGDDGRIVETDRTFPHSAAIAPYEPGVLAERTGRREWGRLQIESPVICRAGRELPATHYDTS